MFLFICFVSYFVFCFFWAILSYHYITISHISGHVLFWIPVPYGSNRSLCVFLHTHVWMKNCPTVGICKIMFLFCPNTGWVLAQHRILGSKLFSLELGWTSSYFGGFMLAFASAKECSSGRCMHTSLHLWALYSKVTSEEDFAWILYLHCYSPPLSTFHSSLVCFLFFSIKLLNHLTLSVFYLSICALLVSPN